MEIYLEDIRKILENFEEIEEILRKFYANFAEMRPLKEILKIFMKFKKILRYT